MQAKRWCGEPSKEASDSHDVCSMQLVFTQAKREEKNRKAKSSAAEKQAKRPLSAEMGVDFLCYFHRLDEFFFGGWVF